ncbi:MAG: PKD domain-containing protein [Chitinophagaceae bacterium]|nr:PKD domain-containing protein [Chitinophagaceae bacterium]
MHTNIYTKKSWIVLYSLLLSISLPAQTADFTYTSTDSFYCDPYKITFTQNCTGNPAGFIWHFGNGVRSGSASETILYTDAGVYNVTLTALYNNTAVSITKTITINRTPALSLTAGNNYLCKPGVVNFTAAGSSFISNYQWNFGDGTPLQNNNSNSASHAYRNYGTYPASVKATTGTGCSAISNYEIVVSKFGISTSLSTDSGCIPVTAVFNTTVNLPAGDRVLNYAWSFGDGSAISHGPDSIVTHVYNTTDSITTASLTITSTEGCSNFKNFPAFAFGTPPFNTLAKTVLLKDSFCGSELIQFHCKAVNANAYLWDFGDSSQITTSDTTVSHKYRSLGNKKIIVTPFFNGCEGPRDSLRIFIKGVIADFIFNNYCSNKNTYRFVNLSAGNISHYEWQFTDDPSIKDSVNFYAAHQFPVYGTFKAVLSLVDNTTGCTDEASRNIYTAVPSFTVSTNSICKDSLISYSVTHSYPGTAGYTYDFYVNGGNISNGQDSVLNYFPATHGSFAEYVIIKDAIPGTCDDTLQLNSHTIVKGPLAVFTVPLQLCVEKAFALGNESHPFYATDAITKWHWDFGDNKEDLLKDPLPHQYTQPSGYDISLTVTDINGCGNNMRQTILAAPMPSVMAFPARDTICGQRDSAMLTGYTIDSLLWLPSTNISCNFCDSTKVYPASTTSYIAQARNRFGCMSYDTCVITVYGPLNLKVFPADTTICPGRSFSFDLNTSGITTWSPSANFSNAGIKNPVVSPSQNTSYTVIVKDTAGCYADTAIANVTILPLPAVNAGDDKILAYKSSFTITPVYAPDVAGYRWEPALNLSCGNCAYPSGTALQTTTYTINTISVNGCTATDKITIAVSCESGNLLLPTAFSPNGNGVNEYFYPIARGYQTIRTFLVFNRNGYKVFERKNFVPNIPSLGWDGSIRNSGNVADSESFVWFIEAECEQGQVVTHKGTVVLVR